MKNFILVGLVIFTITGYSQSDTVSYEYEPVSDDVELDELEKYNLSTSVVEDISQVYELDTVIVEEEGETSKIDTTRLKVGKKSVSVIKDGDDTYIKVIDSKKDKNKDFDFEIDDEENFGKTKRNRSKFEGNWAGLELGLNSYDGEIPEYMELNSGKSINCNINFLQYSFGLLPDNVGLVTGLGFEFNNYRFDNNNSIEKDNLGYIISKELGDGSVTPEKSKLTTVYLTCPLLMEFQIPVSHKKNKKLHFSGGVLGGLKVGSYTRVVYSTKKGDDIKTKDDFNLSPFTYGFTGQIGYRSLNLYARYYLTPMFEKSSGGGFKGPELYPFSIGLVLIPFN